MKIRKTKAVPLWKGAEQLITLSEKLSGGDIELALAMLKHAVEAIEHDL